MIVLAPIGMFFLMEPLEDAIDPGFLALAAVVGLLAAGIFGVIVSQQLGYAKRIEGNYVWLRKVHRACPAPVE